MTFEQIVTEELGADLEAIKAQIKQLQALNLDKDKAIKEKDDAIKELQARLAKSAIPKKQEPRIGIGTRKSIQSPIQAPLSPIKTV